MPLYFNIIGWRLNGLLPKPSFGSSERSVLSLSGGPTSVKEREESQGERERREREEREGERGEREGRGKREGEGEKDNE